MNLPVRPVAAAFVILLSLPFLSSVAVCAAEGDPESSFWSDGKVYFAGSGSYLVNDVVVAPDDRLVVVGTYDPPSGGSSWFWKAVGDDTTSTAATCFFFPPGGASQGRAYSAAFSPGGRLLVAGSADYSGRRLAVASFTYPDCVPDDNFDGDGYWTLDIGGGTEEVTAITVSPSTGKIALGAVRDNGSARVQIVAVLAGDGALDTSFSGDGWRGLDPSGVEVSDSLAGIAFGTGGRVIIAGTSFYGTGGANGNWIVAQLTAAGALDNGFSNDGLAPVAFDLGGADDDQLSGLARDPNSGKLLLTGYVQTDVFEWGLGIARLLPSGALDPTFSGDGKVVLSLGSITITGSDVAVDGLGRVLVAGNFRSSAGVSDFFVMRYTADGELDSTFGYGGLSVVAFDAGPGDSDNDYAQALTMQGGRVVVTGQIEVDADFHYRIGLTRLDVALIFADGYESAGFSSWSSALTGQQ
ncbi:MAG: hypothetical protein ABIV06_09390 [Thermoanaerobaculia bacterium]